MEGYKNIRYALRILNSDVASTDEEFRSTFEKFLNTPYLNADKLREELQLAMKDPNWNWKDAAREANFYAYDEHISEEDIFINFKRLTWDILFHSRSDGS